MASKNYIFYKIFKEDLDETYIGSTSNFYSRKRSHKSHCNNENDKKYNLKIYQTIRDNGGWNEFKMIQIGTRDNITKREAEQIEEQYRLELKGNLNMKRAFLSLELIKEKKKEYHQANKEKIAEHKKEYYQANKDYFNEKHKEYTQTNKDKISEYHKEYHQANKERISEYHKEHYQANKDKIKERQGQVINCECGGRFTYGHKARHMKSQRHINNI